MVPQIIQKILQQQKLGRIFLMNIQFQQSGTWSHRRQREHAKKHFFMLPLKKEGLKSHEDAKLCYICGKWILKIISNIID